MQAAQRAFQQCEDVPDQELIDTLIAISVISRRLARNLEKEAQNQQAEGEPRP